VTVVMEELNRRLVPDELWAQVEPLIPPARTRPQGGGMSRVDDRTVFTAIVFVLTSGCAWRHLPPSFGVTVPTAHRRFIEWTQVGLWRRLHEAVCDKIGTTAMIAWSFAVLDGANARIRKTPVPGTAPVVEVTSARAVGPDWRRRDQLPAER
jgi:transposase